MSDVNESSASVSPRRLLPESSGVGARVRRAFPQLKARARLLRRKWRTADLSGIAQKLENLDEEYVEEGARDVTETDVETVVEEADAIEKRFRENGPLRRLLEDGRLLLGLVRDVRQGRYRDVPVWTLSASVFALLYVLNPFDVVPDALPVLGVLDDAAVISACLALLEQDLYDYRRWRETSADEETLAEAEPTDDDPSEARSRYDDGHLFWSR